MKKINNFLKIVLMFLAVFFFIYYISQKEIAYSAIALSLIPLMLVPGVLRKFHVNITNEMEFIYIVFIIFALLLGSLCKFYDTFHFYDKLIHFISGFLSALTGIYLLVIMKMYNKKNYVFNAIFIIFTSLAVASLWEIFEYTSSIIFKVDPQRVLLTGVTDTMTDIIMALLASILIVILYLYEELNNKKLILKRFINNLN